MIEKPGNLNYDLDLTPKNYFCGGCKARGVKLWREYNTVLDGQSLLCTDCTLKERDESPTSTHKGEPWDGESTSINWRVAAVPTEDGSTYWGYTSVPSRGVCWWWRLEPGRKVMEPEPEPPPDKYRPLEQRVEDVEYLVEADSRAELDLWSKYHRSTKWDENHVGLMQQVGTARGVNGKKMPVCVHVRFAKINGHVIAFYEGTSAVVDHDAIEEWVKKRYKHAKGQTNATNFHNALVDLGIKADVKVCGTCQRLY